MLVNEHTHGFPIATLCQLYANPMPTLYQPYALHHPHTKTYQNIPKRTKRHKNIQLPTTVFNKFLT